MTISPPTNVRLDKNEPARLLACGVDGLVLAIDVKWKSEEFFNRLADLKTQAKSEEADIAATITLAEDIDIFNVQSFGVRGYEWVLVSREFTLRIGNWLKPISRPSLMVEIRSETLWHQGAAQCIERIHTIIQSLQGEIEITKISRLDLCGDILIPASLWNVDLLQHVNCKANDARLNFSRGRKRFSGLTIGKGEIMCRLYDKPLEIDDQSNKTWMYDIWNVESIGDDCRIIRVEFQFRRGIIKELAINTPEELFERLTAIWQYCTWSWLRFVDDASKHTVRQKLLPFWTVVGTAKPNTDSSHPAVRAKAIKATEEQLYGMIVGCVTSLTALARQGDLIGKGEVLDLPSHLAMVIDRSKTYLIDNEEFTERVKRRQAKNIRHEENFAKATRAREQRGVSYKDSSSSRRKHTS